MGHQIVLDKRSAVPIAKYDVGTIRPMREFQLGFRKGNPGVSSGLP